MHRRIQFGVFPALQTSRPLSSPPRYIESQYQPSKVPPKCPNSQLDSSKTRAHLGLLVTPETPPTRHAWGPGLTRPGPPAPVAIGCSEPTSRQAGADPPARALQRPSIGPEARLPRTPPHPQHKRTWIDNPEPPLSTGIRQKSFQVAPTSHALHGLRCGGRSTSAARKLRAPHITSKRVRPSLTTFLSGMLSGRASFCSWI